MGTVVVVPYEKDLYVRSMAVLPVARGQKIGRLLLDEVEHYAASNAFERLYLSTTPFLLAATKLYTLYGFRKSTMGPHELFGTPLFTMEKKLNR